LSLSRRISLIYERKPLMFCAPSVFNQAYPARLRSQFTGFPNISSTNALFCHETGAPAFEESPCGGRLGPMGFLAQEFLLIDSCYWDYEGDRRSLVTLNTSGPKRTNWLLWIEFKDR
jgi:hypothetical protein